MIYMINCKYIYKHTQKSYWLVGLLQINLKTAKSLKIVPLTKHKNLQNTFNFIGYSFIANKQSMCL